MTPFILRWNKAKLTCAIREIKKKNYETRIYAFGVIINLNSTPVTIFVIIAEYKRSSLVGQGFGVHLNIW